MKVHIIRLFIWTLPVLYMILIWLQSSYFNPEHAMYHLSPKFSMSLIFAFGATLELAHLIEFGILYFLLLLALATFGPINNSKELFCLVIAFLYGIIDEIHQHFVPHRSMSIADLIKDTIGILIIWFMIHKGLFRNVIRKVTNHLAERKTKITTRL